METRNNFNQNVLKNVRINLFILCSRKKGRTGMSNPKGRVTKVVIIVGIVTITRTRPVMEDMKYLYPRKNSAYIAD